MNLLLLRFLSILRMLILVGTSSHASCHIYIRKSLCEPPTKHPSVHFTTSAAIPFAQKVVELTLTVELQPRFDLRKLCLHTTMDCLLYFYDAKTLPCFVGDTGSIWEVATGKTFASFFTETKAVISRFPSSKLSWRAEYLEDARLRNLDRITMPRYYVPVPLWKFWVKFFNHFVYLLSNLRVVGGETFAGYTKKRTNVPSTFTNSLVPPI